MAALYGKGIDNLLIEIDSEEVPILDGSSKNFIEAINLADFEISDLVSGLSDAQPDLLQGMTFTDGDPDYDYRGDPTDNGEVSWPEINDWHKDENGNVKPEATMKPKGFNENENECTYISICCSKFQTYYWYIIISFKVDK